MQLYCDWLYVNLYILLQINHQLIFSISNVMKVGGTYKFYKPFGESHK